MVRYAVAAVVALLSSCATSEHVVRYEVDCPMSGCMTHLAYRDAGGMKHGTALNNWRKQFPSASGEQFQLTVQRSRNLTGDLHVRVLIDDREVVSARLGPGEGAAGPVTLAGEVP